jgi:hypothetical protein
MSENINPEDLPDFRMPAKLLDQIYEFTGSTEENRGFLLVFSDQNGFAQVVSQSCSQIVDMGLRKAAEDYLEEYSVMTRPNIEPGEQE